MCRDRSVVVVIGELLSVLVMADSISLMAKWYISNMERVTRKSNITDIIGREIVTASHDWMPGSVEAKLSCLLKLFKR